MIMEIAMLYTSPARFARPHASLSCKCSRWKLKHDLSGPEVHVSNLSCFCKRRKMRKQQFWLLWVERCCIKSCGTFLSMLPNAFQSQCRAKTALFPVWQVLEEVLLPCLPPSLFFPQQSVLLIRLKVAIWLVCWEPSGASCLSRSWSHRGLLGLCLLWPCLPPFSAVVSF